VELEERAAEAGAAAGAVALAEEAAPNCVWRHSARPIAGVSAAQVPVQALAVVAGAEEAVVVLAPAAVGVVPEAWEAAKAWMPIRFKRHWK
jgi:hypothetical protein